MFLILSLERANAKAHSLRACVSLRVDELDMEEYDSFDDFLVVVFGDGEWRMTFVGLPATHATIASINPHPSNPFYNANFVRSANLIHVCCSSVQYIYTACMHIHMSIPSSINLNPLPSVFVTAVPRKWLLNLDTSHFSQRYVGVDDCKPQITYFIRLGCV